MVRRPRGFQRGAAMSRARSHPHTIKAIHAGQTQVLLVVAKVALSLSSFSLICPTLSSYSRALVVWAQGKRTTFVSKTNYVTTFFSLSLSLARGKYSLARPKEELLIGISRSLSRSGKMAREKRFLSLLIKCVFTHSNRKENAQVQLFLFVLLVCFVLHNIDSRTVKNFTT